MTDIWLFFTSLVIAREKLQKAICIISLNLPGWQCQLNQIYAKLLYMHSYTVIIQYNTVNREKSKNKKNFFLTLFAETLFDYHAICAKKSQCTQIPYLHYLDLYYSSFLFTLFDILFTLFDLFTLFGSI